MSMTDQLWFRHPDTAWALGDIRQFHGKDVELKERVSGAVFTVPLDSTHPCDPTHLTDFDDIAGMNNMHEGPLLALLHRRYGEDAIYTFTGDILISINPYKRVGKLYDIPGEDAPLHDYEKVRLPHVYAVADRAYRMMMEESNPSKKNQSLIVSGESGAGKTEACKHVMRYLATLSERYCEVKFKRRSMAAQSVSVEQKVLDCNPFLEAFGNAKTVRNDNSSRFGKFLKIEYDDGRILGARMRHYLLEKARVIAPHEGERNYHIFYQMTRGATPEERVALHIGQPEDFFYLIQGGAAAMTIPGVDDVEEFHEVRKGLTVVGVSQETQLSMLRILSGLLHLGNVRYSDNEKGEAVVANPRSAQLAAELLGAPALPTKLIRRLVKVKGRRSAYEVNLTPKQAAVSRDSLAKTVYERLFTWLIGKCNAMLSCRGATTGFVGILDIFGFEIFELNSFEQLCINYANEKLQNLFNHHIFVMEQEQYRAEGVDVTSIEFINNAPCVDLIERKPTGILSLLDEICYLGRDTTDAAFLDKLDKEHKGKHPYYGNPKKKSSDRFSVMHFAGEVHYCVDGFIEKNNDTLYTDLEELMNGSENALIVEIFDDAAVGDAHVEDTGDASPAHGASTPRPAGVAAAASASSAAARTASPATAGRAGSPAVTGGRPGGGLTIAASSSKTSSTSTIASKFKRQLGALNDTLMATTPHYVRCVKPNKVKKPNTFDYKMILAQLLYSGVLETVRIRRQGFPFRETFVEFWRRACKIGFAVLVPACTGIPPPPDAAYETGPDGRIVDRNATPDVVAVAQKGCTTLCAALIPEGRWTVGRSKVFLKDGALDMILRAFRAYHARRILAWWRMAKQRRIYRRLRRAVRALQKSYRGILIRRRFARVSRQITRLQAHMRRRIAVKRYRRLLRIRANAVTKMQSILRMARAKRRYKRMRHGFGRLQARVRARAARRELLRRRAAVLRLQSFTRMCITRRKYLRMKRVRRRAAHVIGATWRAFAARRRYRRFRHALIKLQAGWRRIRAQRLARKRTRLILLVQAVARRMLVRTKLQRKTRAVVKLQAWWRARAMYTYYRRVKRSVKRIERAMCTFHMRRVLAAWMNECMSAAAWGDTHELSAHISAVVHTYARMRDVPLRERVRVRARMDGFKSMLHAAASSGSEPTVTLLCDTGADVYARDVIGHTPLMRACVCGDSHAAVCAAMIKHVQAAGGAAAAATLVNATNITGETALDIAINAARTSGKRSHDAIIRMLADAGGVATHGVTGDTRAWVDAFLSAPRAGDVYATMSLTREKEMMERRARERRADPHYQYIYMRAEAATPGKKASSSPASATTNTAPGHATSGSSTTTSNAPLGTTSSTAVTEAKADVATAYDVASAAATAQPRNGFSPMFKPDVSLPAGNRASGKSRTQKTLRELAAESFTAKVKQASSPASAAAVTGAVTTHMSTSTVSSSAGAYVQASASTVTPGTSASSYAATRLATMSADPPLVRAESLSALLGMPLQALTSAVPDPGPRMTSAAKAQSALDAHLHGSGAAAPQRTPRMTAVDASAVRTPVGSATDAARVPRLPIVEPRLGAASNASLGTMATHTPRMRPSMDAAGGVHSPAAAPLAVPPSAPTEAGINSVSPRVSSAPLTIRVSTHVHNESNLRSPASARQPVWTAHVSSSTGMTYYHNRVTGESQWTRPADLDTPDVPPVTTPLVAATNGHTAAMDTPLESRIPVIQRAQSLPDQDTANKSTPSRARAATEGATSTAMTASASLALTLAAASHAPAITRVLEEAYGLSSSATTATLPATTAAHTHAWDTYTSSSTGGTYYYNRDTGETTWKRPSIMDEPVATVLDSTSPTGRRTLSVGANGWCAASDADGYVYFYNTLTGVTQWEQPADM